MTRVAPWIAVAALIGVAAWFGLKPKPPSVTGDALSAADERRVAELLADRTRPWHLGHKLPMPPQVKLVYQSAEKMGSFPEPPVACPVMPVELARALLTGRANLAPDHPLAGRAVKLVDMRLLSLHIKDHIPDDVNVPIGKMPESFQSGALKDLDLKTVVILYGDVYPHFDATAHFRVGKFEAYYCLEGGLTAWKAKGYPVVANAPVAEYLAALESEKVVGVQTPSSDPADIGPAAFKALLDQGVDPLIIFVGDETTFRLGHIPNATRVTLEKLADHFEKVPKDRLIAVYCGCCEGSAKGLSGIAVEQLRRANFTRLLHLNGHLKAWKDQGYALDVN
ncbi:MAG TPA: rhodanese-like domain-containing protein [Planctomycetota bacterium]|nr:rhodanese-like domain-containing protein [Planctomycetota bacterium]